MALYLRIASLNCRGLNNVAKRAAIFAYLQQLDAQVLLLQETFSRQYLETFWAHEWSADQACFNLCSGGNRLSSGTATLLNRPSFMLVPFQRIATDGWRRGKLSNALLPTI